MEIKNTLLRIVIVALELIIDALTHQILSKKKKFYLNINYKFKKINRRALKSAQWKSRVRTNFLFILFESAPMIYYFIEHCMILFFLLLFFGRTLFYA